MASNPTTIAPLLVTEREAARLLGISPRTLFTLEKSGAVRAVRLGSAKRYSVAALETLIAEQTGDAGREAQ